MKSKIFSKVLWVILAIFFTLIFATGLVGSYFAFDNAAAVNNFLNCKTYEITSSGDSEKIVYTSPYQNVDGSYNDEALIEANKQTVNQVQGEGSVLLWNDNQALPIAKESKISLFGVRSVDLFRSGYGSGQSQIKASYNLKNALEREENITVNNTLWSFYNSSACSAYSIGNGDTGLNVKEAPWSIYTDKVKDSFSSYGDAAIFVISRKGGEGTDLSLTGSDTADGKYLSLSENEKEVLENVISLKKSGTFKKVILMLNTPGAIQFKDLENMIGDIDCCLWVGQPGYYGVYGIAKVLSGAYNPSGRLVNAFAYDNAKAPAAVNMVSTYYQDNALYNVDTWFQGAYLAYEEGIYVGYRYYETRYEDSVLGNGGASTAAGSSTSDVWKYENEVIFPFGYGKSYTEFEYRNFEVKTDRDGYTVSVDVANVGSIAGKEVVQVYLQKPYTEYDKTNGVEKASVELVGFDKTDILQPGDSVTVEIFVEKEALKSYDANNAKTYIVEGSDAYYLATGTDSHDALNNILAAKGKTTADGMDYDGDAAFAHQFTVAEDFNTYAESITEYEITNRFDHADWNKYEGASEDRLTYLSRSDWENTFPDANAVLSMTEQLAVDTSWDETVNPLVEDPEAVMPTYGKDNGISLAMMKDVPYDNEDAWNDFMDQLTFEQCSELSANAMKSTISIGGVINKPQETTEDGPLGMNRSYTTSGERTMSFPTSPVVAATWNRELIEKMGVQKGADMMHSGATGIYAPAVNIHRSHWGGRNYEYYSEDSYLSGVMATAETIGIQSLGNYVTLKHFALNDQETHRTGVSVWANEQSIREIYLSPFQMAIEEGDAYSVMSSFTRVGPVWNGADYNMCTEVLRNEWGFEGFVISDCAPQVYMTFSTGVLAGNDCTLYSNPANSFEPWKDNATVMQALRESCRRIMYVVANSNAMNGFGADTKIKLVTPWWKPAIIAVDVFLGALFVGSVTMAVLSFIKSKKTEDLIEGVVNDIENNIENN